MRQIGLDAIVYLLNKIQQPQQYCTLMRQSCQININELINTTFNSFNEPNICYISSSWKASEIKMQDWIWQSSQLANFTWEDEIILPKTWQIHQKMNPTGTKSTHLAKEQFTLDTLLATILQVIISDWKWDFECLFTSSLLVVWCYAWPAVSKLRQIRCLANIMDRLNNVNQSLLLNVSCNGTNGFLMILIGQCNVYVLVKFRGSEPMQVVSGRLDYPTVHFEAAPPEKD